MSIPAPAMTIDSTMAAIEALSPTERNSVRRAARNDLPVEDDLRAKAYEFGLAYRSTGRVRPIALDILR